MKKTLSIIGISLASLSTYAQTNTFPTDGNVGIGTVNPTDKLEVGGSMRSWNWHPAGSASDDLYLDVEPGTRILRTRNFNAASPNITVTGIHTGTGYFENAIGIGTTTPGAELELLGNFIARHKGANVANTNISAINFIPNGTPYNNPVAAVRASFTGSNWYSGSKLSFFTNPGPDITATESVERLTIDANGNIGIGITNPSEKLAVKGNIHSQEVIVDMNGWSDYVFKNDYSLMSIEDVKAFIDENHHLPNVPSEKEVISKGIKLGDMNAKLLEKIEELTLYLIEKNQQLKDQQKINKRLEDRLDQLEQKLK